MARIRTVKPSFWGHPVMGRLPAEVKCLALALLNLVDDEGLFLAEPALVRAFADPFNEDSRSIQGALDELCRVGWIEVKAHPTHGPIGRVVNFTEHQVINRPTPSTLRAYFDSLSPHGTISAGSGSGSGSGSGKETPTPSGGGAPPAGAGGGEGAATPNGRRRRRSRAEILEPFPAELRACANRLLELWPREDPTSGREVKAAPAEMGANMLAILREHPELSLDVLEQAAQEYLQSERMMWKAPQYFFGPGKGGAAPPWEGYARHHMTRSADPPRGAA